ncbi:hypothetical protein [Streptomyces violascens]|uniref:Lipoprotein n=1 Tax=Streptomyces violascens TaxID=67381 RepID=A0ABQ3QV98_9ACTN|nr:hypothetical protein [Streptomyces violascens]GGU26375.1 hypothetical protein GCM10010289_54590 [Streptomyces violascens]GHI41196.1 hypothetical protein Sviol_56040 [Streptomyces violascens]
MRPTGVNRCPRPAAALAVIVVTSLALTACGSVDRAATPESPPSAAIQPITRVVVLASDGQTVTTVIPVGGCQKGQLTGAETGTTVQLRLSLAAHQKSGEVCAAYIKLDHVSYKLRTSLDNRTIMDEATGKPLSISKP